MSGTQLRPEYAHASMCQLKGHMPLSTFSPIVQT